MKNKNMVSDELKKELDKIKDDGLNIYVLLQETRRKAKNPDLFFPEKVLMKVCNQYWFYRYHIRKPFVWFVKVLYMEWCAHNARGYEAMSENNKNNKSVRGGCATIGNILQKMNIREDDDREKKLAAVWENTL